MRFPILSTLPVAALLAGCGGGDGPEAPPPWRLERPRLEVEVGVDAARPTRTPVALPEDPGTWHVRGRSLVEAPPGELRVSAGPKVEGRGGEEVLLRGSGRFDTRAFEQVELTGTFPGAFEVLIQFDGGGKPFRPQACRTREQDGPQRLLFDLAGLGDRVQHFQALTLLVRGPRRAFSISSIDLVRQPPQDDLPPLGSPALVALGAESRPAQGLLPGVLARCTFQVHSADDQLSFTAAVPPRHRPSGAAPRLEVTVTAADGTREELTLDLREPGWHEGRVALEAFAGREVTARFHHTAEPSGAGIVALGDLRVWHPAAQAPTTLLVSSDTHRADHVAAMELGVELDTPGLDALAAQGLVFEQAWASTNNTSPSHVAIMTGVHPRDTRLVSNLDELTPQAYTLGEAFQAQGWRTLTVVSVRHLGPRGTNCAQGFDRALAPRAEPWSAEVAVEALEGWLEESAGLPTFAFLHLFDAHHPYQPPGEFDRLYYPGDRDPYDPAQPAIEARRGSMPADYWGRLRDVEFPKAQYRAEVAYLDGVLGRLLARPRVAAGLIAFTSDHGEILEKAGTYFNHGEIYPDTLHVPLLLGGAALPDEFAGRRVPGRVSQLGLARTLLDLSNLHHVEFPGRNLLLELDSAEDPLFALSAHGFSASMTSGDWYLLLHLQDHQGALAAPRKKHQVELFDLSSDPECLRDVSTDEPERAAALRRELVAWLADTQGPSLSTQRVATEEELAQLLALGYASEAIPTEAGAWYQPD